MADHEIETQAEDPTPPYEWWRLLVEVEDESLAGALGGAHRRSNRPS
jgi:hypothetical protein